MSAILSYEDRSETYIGWQRVIRIQEHMISRLLRQEFGEGLRQSILAKAERRGLTERFKKAGYSLWQD